MNIDWKTYLVNFILHYVMIAVGVFVAHFGWLNMDANNVSLAITQFLVAALIAGIPWLINHFKLGLIVAKAKTLITQAAASGSVPLATNNTISPLAGITKAAMILMCIGLIGSQISCKSSGATTQPTPTQALTTAISVTDTAILAATVAYDDGLISKSDLQNKLLPLLNTIANAEVAAKTAYEAGDSATSDARYADVLAAEAAFNSVLQSIEHPTTQPTTN